MAYIPDYIRDYLDRFPDTKGNQLADTFELAGRTARRWVKNYRDMYLNSPSVDERRELLREYLESSFIPSPVNPKKDNRRIVAIGDFHGRPDHKIIARVVQFKPDIIVFGGDTFDHLSASRWPDESKRQAKQRIKNQGHDEIKEIRSLIEFFLEHTDAIIYILLGNHDVRVVKRLLEVMPDYILEYYRDPIEIVCDGLEDRVFLVNQTIDYTYPNGEVRSTDMSNEFVYVLGDVLFSHMNFTSSMTETAASKLYRKWFEYWERPLGLQHVNVLVQFHSHQRNLLSLSEGHMLLIEPGMAGSIWTEDYKFGYNGGWRPSTRGFLVLDQVKIEGKWITVPDSIELVAPYLTQG